KPRSETTSVRRKPSSRASVPSSSNLPSPNTTRVRIWKSNGPMVKPTGTSHAKPSRGVRLDSSIARVLLGLGQCPELIAVHDEQCAVSRHRRRVDRTAHVHLGD